MAKYPKVTLGRIEAVWNKLGGENAVDAFLTGESVLVPVPPFAQNEHGHYVVQVRGKRLSLQQELDFLDTANIRCADDHTRQALEWNTQYNDSCNYSGAEQLKDDALCTAVFVPDAEFPKALTRAEILAYGESYGYRVPRAGVMFRLNETVSPRHMERMDGKSFIGLHAGFYDGKMHLCYINIFVHGARYFAMNRYKCNDDETHEETEARVFGKGRTFYVFEVPDPT